jgi:multidrug resistance efflux pump
LAIIQKQEIEESFMKDQSVEKIESANVLEHTAAVDEVPLPKEKVNILMALWQKPWLVVLIVVLLGAGGYLGGRYWLDQKSKVYIEKAEVWAPVINLTSSTPGILDQMYVAIGDKVMRDQHIAKVGSQIIVAKTAGVIVDVADTPGAIVAGPVARMIDPRTLRIVGHLEEDKGLADIKVGHRVVFTIDAFGSKQYEGVIEKIAETAHTGDIVFSISDKRQTQRFDVYATFNINTYPELKNGMSAKMWADR